MIGNTFKKDDEFCFGNDRFGFQGWNVIRYLCLEIRRLIPAIHRFEIRTGN